MKGTKPVSEPKVPLSHDRVLQAAITLVGNRGFDALTMRKLADELGVGVMSIYHYFSNRDELLAGMVEIVFSEIEAPPSGVEWKTALRQRANSTRAALRKYPWAVGLMESGKMPGPASLRLHNAVLGCLRGAGFSIEMTIQAYSVQDAYIYGFALQEKTVPFEDAEGAAALAEAQAAAFANLEAEYPHLAEVVAGHVAKEGYDFGDTFEYGLNLILEGLEKHRDE